MCPNNQIYLEDAHSCQTTCQTYGITCPDDHIYTGCGCPENTTLAPDVRHRFFSYVAQKSVLNQFWFTLSTCIVIAYDIKGVFRRLFFRLMNKHFANLSVRSSTFLRCSSLFSMLRPWCISNSAHSDYSGSYIEDLTRVVISYEIYETSLRRVS